MEYAVAGSTGGFYPVGVALKHDSTAGDQLSYVAEVSNGFAGSTRSKMGMIPFQILPL